MPAPRFVLDDFWPSDLFLGGIPGAWYDPTDLSTMFQDSTGTTPVTAVEQPVGLILDKSQGLALGSELVANGTFNSGITGWNNFQPARGTVSWNAAAQRLRVDNTTGTGDAYVWTNTAVTAGKTYKIEYNFYKIAGASGSAEAKLYWWNGVATVGTISQIATISNNLASFLLTAPAGATSILIGSDVTQIWEIDNVTVRELAGNHASQSTAASRPTYRARYNLLTFSEQFENAYWSKFQSSVTQDATTAPDGATTADKLVENAVNNAHAVDSSSVTVVGTTFTFSVYLKAAERSFVRAECIQLAPSVVSRSAVVNLSNGALTSVDPAITATATSVGNGWYRCVFTTTYASATSVRLTLAMGTSASTFSYLGDGTSGLFLWGAQLLTAADVTATGNAYQRIAAATVYDTAPIFRPYLAFDGVDDSLSTAAINFTSTDKMTVFAGVTKSSDAGTGMVAELSADAGANNGAFYLTAPNQLGDNFGFVSRGTINRQIVPTGFAAPMTSVLTALTDIAAPSLALRRNGTQIGSSVLSQGTGTFGNYAMFIGRRNNSIYPLNGRLFSLIVRGAASSTTEIIDTETWVNARTGGY